MARTKQSHGIVFKAEIMESENSISKLLRPVYKSAKTCPWTFCIWFLINMLFVDKITWLSTEIMHESTALVSFEYLNNEDHLKLVHMKVWNSYYECSILLPGLNHGNFMSAYTQNSNFVITEFLWAWNLKILLSEISEIAFKDINRLIHVIKDSKFTYPRWNILKPTHVENIRSCITEVSSNWTRKEIGLLKISRHFTTKDEKMIFYVHVDRRIL